MNFRIPLIASALLATSLVSGTAHATLEGRDLNGSIGSFEAYYDTDLNITWLADANYAKTSGYDADGRMRWPEATAWVTNLIIVDEVNNITYENWRLPTVKPVNGSTFNYATSYNGSTDWGYNVSEQGTVYAGSTDSEMAHLFYNTLNNKGFITPSSVYPSYTEQTGWGLSNTGPFTNIQASYYWSSTEFAPDTGYAWGFDFGNGAQGAPNKVNALYAWAVSSGDVGIAAIPEPETYAMMLAGLGLVGFMARRRKLAKV